jgi:hypothetical protein
LHLVQERLALAQPVEQPCRRAARLRVPPTVRAVLRLVAQLLVAPRLAVSPSMVSGAGRERAMGVLFSRAPAPFHAPAAARQVLPAVAVGWAEALPRVAQHEEPPPAVGVAARLDVAVAAEAVPLGEEVAAVEAPRDVVAVAPQGAAVAAAVSLAVLAAEQPSAVAPWACRQDLLLPGLAPLRSAPTARGMALLPIAWPQELSWQAELIADLSCALGPGEF